MKINKYMNKLARHCYEEVDLVVFVVDRSKWLKEEKDILNNLIHLNKPVICIDGLFGEDTEWAVISSILTLFEYNLIMW